MVAHTRTFVDSEAGGSALDRTRGLADPFAAYVRLLGVSALWRGDVKGAALLEVHHTLAQRTPLTRGAFDRCIALFHLTVDDLVAGSTANHAKQSASRISMALQHNIAAEHGAEVTNAS